MRPPAHRSRRRCAAIALLAAVLALALGAAPAAAASGTWTFEYTGETQSFSVPTGVTELSVMAIGGAGAESGSNLGGGIGGVSGAAYGRFKVKPGEELTIWVGNHGLTAQGSTGIAWGFGCGATGGQGSNLLDAANGGGGGAASAVTRGGFGVSPGDCAARPETSEIIAVGAGGGGGGATVAGLSSRAPGESGAAFGGVGGDGGNPAGAGGASPFSGPGGCGGCESTANGEVGTTQIGEGGGAGGGGGGFRGGHGGGVDEDIAGGGGGGGLSYLAAEAEGATFLAGSGTGAGVVKLSAIPSEVFQCTGAPQETSVPFGAGLLTVEASGGHGGTRGEGVGGPGGVGGSLDATFPVSPGEALRIAVGCAGTREPGWGYGIGGVDGQSPEAFDGASGGGSSAIERDGRLLFIAAGGGGGGGNGNELNHRTGGIGGTGGRGGVPAESASEGQPQGGGGGPGGAGGSLTSLNGGEGGADGESSDFGGGGGGGGAGWMSGNGGTRGGETFNLGGAGGGGGGGGLSVLRVASTSFEFGHSELAGNGLVSIGFLPGTPETISVYTGSKQQATIGSPFGHPLAALVTDASGGPVADVEVEFKLPASGASGTFTGGATTAVERTNADGFATSPALTADLEAGSWEASAEIIGLSEPIEAATFGLANVPAPTATTVTSSDDPASPTESVTFTARVAAGATAGTPGGAVEFLVDGTQLGTPVALSGSGEATSAPIDDLALGGHLVEAVYAGESAYTASTGKLELTSGRTATATTVTSSDNPAVPGEKARFTATVHVPPGSTAFEGSVEFEIGGVEVGSVAVVNGVATSPEWEATGSGQVEVIALAQPSNLLFAESDGTMFETVEADGVAVEVGASANPVEFGVPLELDATVTPRPPATTPAGGEVTFHAGGLECKGALSGGHAGCAIGTLAPGEHAVEATFPGDSNYGAAAGSAVEQVTKAGTLTTVGGGTGGESTYGEPVHFEAAVGRLRVGTGTPGGTVQFALDGSAVGMPVALAAGDAESAAVTPSAGPHALTATYSGGADFKESHGSDLYVVLPATTSVALSSSAPGATQPGEAVHFTATVASPAPAGGAAPVPTGSVLFRVDGTDLGAAVPLVAGTASSEADAALEPGSHDVRAIYLPANEDFDPGFGAIEQGVDQPTTTNVATTANPIAAGAAVRVAAHVGPQVPGGTVAFAVDGAPVLSCQAVAVEGNDAGCTLPGLAAGTHQVSATYSGAGLFDPSHGTVTQKVEAAPVPAPTPPSPPPPAEACKPRDLSASVLLFHSLKEARLNLDYRTPAAAKVTAELFAARATGRRGRRLTILRHAFKRPGLAGVDVSLRLKLTERILAAGGFIAILKVPAAAGYCALRSKVELGKRRRVLGRATVFGPGKLRPR